MYLNGLFNDTHNSLYTGWRNHLESLPGVGGKERGALHPGTTTDATIGKNNLGTDYFDGNLANVAIWNRALSSDEINSVMWKSYDGLTPSETSGLQAWYSLDDISGSSVPDSSGNGNNGTAY